MYPLYFCDIRWVENKCVTDGMVEVWPNIKQIMKFWKILRKYKSSPCKSYYKISDAVTDVFTKAEIIFLTCSIVELYLKKYQFEKSMVKFMYVDLKSIATNFLQLTVKPEAFEKYKTAKQLAEINLDEKGNLLPINKVKLGFGVHGLLSKLNKKDIITIEETKKFKKKRQSFVVSTFCCKKIFYISPFICEFVRYCAVLNPVVLVSCERKSCQKHFKLFLNELMKQNILLPP